MRAWVGVLMLSACTVGSDPPLAKEPDAAEPDIDAPPADAAPLDATITTDAAFQCRDAVAPTLDGHHNPGMDCMAACHDHGFTAAGTLYTTVGGGAPLAGATITLIDATGRVVDVVSATNGNFYSALSLTQPLTVWASKCPNLMRMNAPAGGGTSPLGCNQGGCHAAGNRIHLP